MKNVTKISIAFIGLALIGVTTYSITFKNTKNPTLESLRTQARDARDREIQAQKEREIREDNLSQALYDSCYSRSITQTGSKFEEKQRNAYECWKSESTNINSGTVASAISEVPPKGKSIAQVQTSDLKLNTVAISAKEKSITEESVVKNVKKTEPQKSSEKSNYWKSYEFAISMIKKWEGLRLKAYYDYGHCSIGYGSYAKSCNEVITVSEANRRLSATVNILIKTVQKDFPTLTSKQQGALASFAYNCSKGYQSLAKNGLKYHGQWCKTANGVKLGGLVKRRAEESAILFQK